MTSISTALPFPFLSDIPGVQGWQAQIGSTATARDPTLVMGKGTNYELVSIEGFGVPSMQVTDVPFPYQDGIAALGDFHGPRTVSLAGVIKPTGCATKEIKAQAVWNLMQALNGAWQARQFDTLLKFRWVTGQSYFLRGRPRECAVDQHALWRGLLTWQTQFLATEPRLFSTTVESRQSALSDISGTKGLCMDPPGAATCLTLDGVTQGYFGGLPTNGMVTANVQGNTTTPPYISIIGPTTGDSTVTNDTTGESFVIAGAIAGGDTIDVDCGARTIQLGTTNRFNLLRPGSSMFWLVPGDNVIRLRTSNNTTGTLQVRWRNAWI